MSDAMPAESLVALGHPMWAPTLGMKAGDMADVRVPRSRWSIWCDRIRLLRWDVPKTEPATMVCAGSMAVAVPGDEHLGGS